MEDDRKNIDEQEMRALFKLLDDKGRRHFLVYLKALARHQAARIPGPEPGCEAGVMPPPDGFHRAD